MYVCIFYFLIFSILHHEKLLSRRFSSIFDMYYACTNFNDSTIHLPLRVPLVMSLTGNITIDRDTRFTGNAHVRLQQLGAFNPQVLITDLGYNLMIARICKNNENDDTYTGKQVEYYTLSSSFVLLTTQNNYENIYIKKFNYFQKKYL